MHESHPWFQLHLLRRKQCLLSGNYPCSFKRNTVLLRRGKAQRRIRVTETPKPQLLPSLLLCSERDWRAKLQEQFWKRGLIKGRNGSQSKGARTEGRWGKEWIDGKWTVCRQRAQRKICWRFPSKQKPRLSPGHVALMVGCWGGGKTEPFRLRVGNLCWMFKNLKIKGTRKQAW